jgi:protein-disulfide isomerase
VSALTDLVGDQDRVRGNKNAQLTWIEYSDLQCPFCKKIHPDLVRALDEYDGKLKWVYRHFPLSSIHPRAQKSAEAAECVASSAGDDAFWKFIDNVFSETAATDVLEDAGLVKAAAAAGANGSKVQACITSGEMASKVQANYDSGSKSGITGTPGGFLFDSKGNAWVINGAVPYATIKQVIDAALKS